MTNEQAINELKNYHREDGTVPEEITLAIKALETGEIYITGEDYNLYMEGYKSGLSDGRKDAERPQGEWLGVVCENGGFFHGTCSVCKIRNDIPPLGMANFCPNCGADMRGGAE